MLDTFRPAFCVAGLLLCALSLAMLLAGAVESAAAGPDQTAFYVSGTLTLFIGASLAVTNRIREAKLSIRQGFLVTSLSWIMIALFASLPFRLCALELSYSDALFEATSGLTTTGATIIPRLAEASSGVLIWRALLQWIGGIGIIVTALAVLPMLNVGGMQLFRMESSDNSEKILPRSAQLAGVLTLFYGGFTLACATGYWLAGMSPFDSIAHAMTTLATGGFSTSDMSIGHWRSPAIDSLAILFMILGSLPFILYMRLLGGDVRILLRDTQLRWFLAILFTAVALMWAHLYASAPSGGGSGGGEIGLWRALQLAAFNVTSVMTGTGYATADYAAWSPFAASLFFFLMFIGGCAGSTACGMKIFRLVVVCKSIHLQTRKLLHPHRAGALLYNGRPMQERVIASVMRFLFFYFALFLGAACLLSLMGIAPVTALSAAASAIANVGPGLGGEIGPAGTYAFLPNPAKWLLAMLMLVGRLEVFTILVLLSPSFWRQ